MPAESRLEEPAFNIIPQKTNAFLIWRIEKLEVVPLPRDQYGKFYKGDSYIIYSASDSQTVPGTTIKSKPTRGPLEVHIHFWLGSETSQDEAAVAAMKSVQLDMSLGGTPIQHRETEGNESKRFLSYFKEGIRLLKGGVATGLRKVTDDFKPTLYHIKGKRLTFISELPQINWSEMNDGDVYVLHLPEYIFVWTGRYANNMEKIQAAKFATTLKNENGKGIVIIVEDGQEPGLPVEEKKAFDAYLPLNNKQVIPASEAPKDEVVARRLTEELKLFQCSDQSGTLKVTEVKNGPLFQSDLNSNDSFIIDNGHQGIWVWIGKRATQKEREEALRNAQGFVSKKGYPVNTQVSRIIDGGEPPEFKSLFKEWKSLHESTGFGERYSGNKIAQTVQTKFDAGTLHEQPTIAAKTQMVDDGTGQKEVWRVKNFDLEEVHPRNHGEFFMGDCYVVLYAYNDNNRDNYIIYYWIGVDASQDEAGTAALKAVELDDRLNGRAVQVRVTQGKEPAHFMMIFKGSMITYEGGYASSFDGSGGRNYGRKNSYMLQVRGTTEYNTKAVEVDFRAGSLNSNDCFIIYSQMQTYVWCGKGSTGDEREMAKNIAKNTADPILISEGSEKPEFWQILGGKESYANDKQLQKQSNEHPPRLFHMSNATGVFKAEEVINFSQEDLEDDDVMLLDAWDTLFLWIGVNANRDERSASEQLAWEYLRTDPAGRDKGTSLVKLKQGYEPPNFTGFFGVWDNDLWNNNETYEDICTRLEHASPGATILVTSSGGSGSGIRTYPLATLREKSLDKLPDSVNPTKKEEYLCDVDFHTVFGMDRDSFKSLPEWKRMNLKKKAGLF